MWLRCVPALAADNYPEVGRCRHDRTRRDPDLQPSTFTTDALARAFPRGSGRVLCARADIAPEGLEDALSAKGWEPIRVVAYRTHLATSFPREVRHAVMWDEIDAVTFTSASTVRNFVAMLGQDQAVDLLGATVVAAIGPVTAEAAQQLDISTNVMPTRYTIPDLVDALVEHFAATAATPVEK